MRSRLFQVLGLLGSAGVLGILCVLSTWLVARISEQMVRPPLQVLDHQIVDLAFQVRPVNRAHDLVSPDDVVIIDLDDASIEALGRPQTWPRAFDAGAIRYIASGAPLTIGIDYLYTEPDTLPEVYADLMRRRGVPDPEQVIHALSTDADLAEAIRDAGNVYLSFFDDEAVQSHTSPIHVPEYLRLIPGDTTEFPEVHALNYPVFPVQAFAEGARAVGSIAMPTGLDGTVRDYRLFQRLSTGRDSARFIANFPFYILLDAYGVRAQDIRFVEDSVVLANDLRIPLRRDASFRINWLGSSEEIRYIPFYKILNGLVPAEYFQDKFIFFGTSASGLQDLKTVPCTADKMPGVEVHAVAFLNMINQAFLREYSMHDLLHWFLLAGSLMVLFFLLLRPLLGFIVAVALVAGELFGYVLWLFPQKSAVLPMVSIMLLTFLAYLSSNLYTYFVRERKSRRLKYAFGSYVSPEVVEQIMRDPAALHLGGEKRLLTVLFSDIRGFTAYSETMDPAQIVAMLNEYLSLMSDCVFRHKGTIDKFIGDAIMAVFGAPVPQVDHADRACLVALDMIRALEAFNASRMDQGQMALEIGIGINTGEMTVGNIGSKRRFDYTVIGDAVNLGSRIEGLTKFFGAAIVVSESSMRACREGRFIFRELADVKVKGKDVPVKVFALDALRTSPQDRPEWEMNWEEAMQAFREARFAEARMAFERTSELLPGDGPSAYYIRRCEACLKDPSQFSGIIVREDK